MAGLDTRGLASGFSQGFGLMSQHQQREKQNKRANQRMDMQEDRMDMQRERFGMQKEQAEAEQQEAQRESDMKDLQFTLGKISNGMDVDDSEVELLRKYPKYWAALDADTDASIEQAQNAIDPESPVDANDPESLAALNQMFGAEINKGEGGHKRVVGMVPAPDGESVMLELEVDGEGGKRYNAPMTDGRSNSEDDDLVKSVPVGRLVEQVQGMRTLRNTLQGPEAQKQASKVLGILRGEGDEDNWVTEDHPKLGMVQRNTKTGEVKPVKPGAGSPYEDTDNYWNRPTATQKDIEYMVSNGLAPDRETAWEMLNERSGDNSYSRSEDRIEALRNRAESLEEVIKGEGASIPTDDEIKAARDELASLRQEIRQEENSTYNISDQSTSSGTQGSNQPSSSTSRSSQQESRQEPKRDSAPKESQQGATTADDILNKYL
ncbi:hypothetical protein HLV40_07015 [Chromohalobacter salexigens]|nr:hypothetical protein [Chromohalobacter salexigens]